MARRRWRPSREAAEVEDVAGGDGAAEVEASAGGDDARWRAAAQVGEEQGAVAAADVDVDDVRGRGDGADLRAGEEQDGGRGDGRPERGFAGESRPERSARGGLGEFGDRIVDPHSLTALKTPLAPVVLYNRY